MSETIADRDASLTALETVYNSARFCFRCVLSFGRDAETVDHAKLYIPPDQWDIERLRAARDNGRNAMDEPLSKTIFSRLLDLKIEERPRPYHLRSHPERPADTHQGLCFELADDLLQRCKDGCEENPYPRRELMDLWALMVLEHDQMSKQLNRGQNAETTDDPPKDGPEPPDGFNWQGQTHQPMRRQVFMAIQYLWTQWNRTAEIRDLAEPVWQDHGFDVDQEAIKGLRRDINNFFRRNHIPFHAQFKDIPQEGKYLSLRPGAPREMTTKKKTCPAKPVKAKRRSR